MVVKKVKIVQFYTYVKVKVQLFYTYVKVKVLKMVVKKVKIIQKPTVVFGIPLSDSSENIDMQLYNKDLKLSRINYDLCKKFSFRADIERFDNKIGPILLAHVIKSRTLK